jgi:hypothetical protein
MGKECGAVLHGSWYEVVHDNRRTPRELVREHHTVEMPMSGFVAASVGSR